MSLFYNIPLCLTFSFTQEWEFKFSSQCFNFYFIPLYLLLLSSENSCYFVSLCSMLPDTLLTCHMYAQFISLYRQLLTEVIMDEGRDSQVAGNYWLYGAYATTEPLARDSAFFPVLTMRETSVLISNCHIVEVFKRNITSAFQRSSY